MNKQLDTKGTQTKPDGYTLLGNVVFPKAFFVETILSL